MELPTRRTVVALTLLVPTFAWASACVSMQTPARSGLIAQAPNVVVDARLVVTQVDELTGRWLRSVEWSADQIRAASTDATVRRNALLWKTNGSSAMLRATSHGDPLIDLLDAWTLVLQFRDYFQSGRGATMFGEHGAIARASADSAVLDIERTAERIATPDGVVRGRRLATDFATREPIANDHFLRSSMAGELVAALDEQDRDALATLGALSQTVEMLSPRISLYIDYLPRLARWQAELLLEDPAIDARLEGAVDSIEGINATVAHLGTTLDRTVDSRLDQLLNRALAQVTAEFDDVERLINVQRELLIARLPQEYDAIFAKVNDQRLAVFDQVDSRIDDALSRIDHVARRGLGSAETLSRDTVDYAFARAIPLLIGVFVGVLILIVVYRLVPQRVKQA
jgi:hypothetical protein